jgi:hypothetical protein
VAVLTGVLLWSAWRAALGACLPPGSLASTNELQFGAGALYNPHLDEYLVSYADGAARAVRLRPDGTVIGEIALSADPRPQKKVYEVQAAYNPDRREYLAVWRHAEPNEIFARYLDDRAQPLGQPIPIVLSPDQGVEINVSYAVQRGRYLVLWTNWSTKTVRHRMIAGDSRSAQPLLGGVRVVEQGAVSGVVAYGGGSDRFLAAFAKDFAPEPRRAEVYARFIDGAGESVGALFALSTGPLDQQRPRVAYAAGHDRWLVVFEDWRAQATRSADVNGVLVDASGIVSARFPVAATAGTPDNAWDAPGEVTFNPASDRFLVAWYLAEVTYAREVDPTIGALGPVFTICDQDNAAPTAAAARTVTGDPQFLVSWRSGYRGLNAALIATPSRADGGAPDGGAPDGGTADAGAAVDGGAIADGGAGSCLRALSLEPSSGVGQAQLFRATYEHCEGASAFRIAQIWVGDRVAPGVPAVAGAFENGAFSLGVPGETCTPGQSGALRAAYGLLDCAASFVSFGGRRLTVGWALTFDASRFAGAHRIFLDAKGGRGDPEPRLGWTELGSFTVAPPGTLDGGSEDAADAGTSAHDGGAGEAVSPPPTASGCTTTTPSLWGGLTLLVVWVLLVLLRAFVTPRRRPAPGAGPKAPAATGTGSPPR